MYMRIFAVYDSKAGAFMQPFFCVNRAVAVRMFAKAVKDEATDFFKFAADYTLHELGEWHPEEGKLVPLSERESVASALQFVSSEV